MGTEKTANASTTVVAIRMTDSDDAEVIPKLRRFAWDEPVPRIARLGDDLLIDLADLPDDSTLDRLQQLLGRPVRRADPLHMVWTPLAISEEDG